MKSTFWYWFFAVVITISAAIYQRVTGPTHPKLVKYEINGVKESQKFPRSGDSGTNLQIELNQLPSGWTAILNYRLFPKNDNWTQVPFAQKDANRIASELPTLPTAGKYEYFIEVKNEQESKVVYISKDEPVVVRFKNPVPAWALIPHILLMFVAMLLSNLTGVLSIFMHDKFRYYGVLTLAILFVGGFIFGPIVQYYAFGQAWTGFPFGYDLTDNKTLIALVAWGIAVLVNLKEKRPLVSLFAAVVMIIVFSIPHSLRGSALNYETGKVITGFIPYIKGMLPF